MLVLALHTYILHKNSLCRTPVDLKEGLLERLEVGEAEGQFLISAKWRFPKPTNPCRNLMIFMEENLLKKIVMAAPSVARKKKT